MKVFFHVGLMKTGSTFLQRQVIPKLDIQHFLDPKRIEPRPENIFSLASEIEFNKIAYDEAKAKVLNLFELQKNVGAIYEKTLLSTEAAVGNPFLGFINQDRLADLIKDTFPDVKILITLRRQDDFAESLYIQTIHRSYRWGGVDDFLNRDGDKFGSFKYSNCKLSDWSINPRISVLDLDWNKLVNLYTERFGADNVLVLPYEFLVENPLGFIEEWCKFIDCRMPNDIELKYENRSYSKLSFSIARILNRFVYRNGRQFYFIVNKPFCNRLRPHISHSRVARLAYGILRRIDLQQILQEYVDRIYYTPARPFDGELKKAILEVHKKTNMILSKRTGMELEKYGYF